ncbi:MAG TPA: hypothetical protein VJL29_12955 [Thermoguttaceae bacterium]|nr:hypothetical protein [Thermoguttaceae bacterium]
MDVNPYQSPEIGSLTGIDQGFGVARDVDGKCLVLTSGTVLPPICVKSNQPVHQYDMVERHFYWCSPLVGLLILLSGPLLILVYFLARKKCSLTFGLHPELKRKYRKRMLLKVVAVIGLFFAIPFASSFESPAVVIIALVLFLVAVVSLFIGNSPLSVVKHHRGRFWIRGFSEAFLAKFDQPA